MDLVQWLKTQIDTRILCVNGFCEGGIECGDIWVRAKPKVGRTEKDAVVIAKKTFQKVSGDRQHAIHAEMGSGWEIFEHVGDEGGIGGCIVDAEDDYFAGRGPIPKETAGEGLGQGNAMAIADEIETTAFDYIRSEHRGEVGVGAGEGIGFDLLIA